MSKESQFVCECGYEEFWAIDVGYGVKLECTRCNRKIGYTLPAKPLNNIQTDYITLSLEQLKKLMSK